jgi:ribosomal protein S18 acetylase RimI-like enzyme
MEIIEHPLELDQSLTALLADVDRLDFSEYRQLSKRDLMKIFRTELKMIMERNYDPKMFLVLEERRPSGLIIIENLEWDKAIFGIKMGRFIHVYLGKRFENRRSDILVLLNHILGEFKQRKIQHVSIKVNVDDWPMIKTLQEMSFMVMDTTVNYSIELKKAEIQDIKTSFKIRYMKEEDADNLIGLCREIYSGYKYDRFHREPLFQEEKSTNLYVEWIRNQINKDAEEITIAEMDGEIVGFSTLQFYKGINEEIALNFADIAIAGVSQKSRGKNIYPAMTLNHISYAKERNIDFIKTTTHVNNISVHKALIKLGFKPSCVMHTFHKNLF